VTWAESTIIRKAHTLCNCDLSSSTASTSHNRSLKPHIAQTYFKSWKIHTCLVFFTKLKDTSHLSSSKKHCPRHN